jgi:hypothetical protein
MTADRELPVLMAWLERYPATIAPPNPHNESWWVSGGKFIGAGDNPIAALRMYRKAMMAHRRRKAAPTDGAV